MNRRDFLFFPKKIGWFSAEVPESYIFLESSYLAIHKKYLFLCNTEQKTEKMANKEKIDYLLLDIRELEKLVAGVRDAEVYPLSFFSQTFELSHKILNDLHLLEAAQIEALRQQMEAHEQLMQSISARKTDERTVVSTTSRQSETLVEETSSSARDVRPTAFCSSLPLEPEKETPDLFQEELPAASPQFPDADAVATAEEKITEDLPTTEAIPSSSSRPLATEKTGISLNEVLEKQNLSDFRKAFSLNDRFRFRRELFGGDETRMNRAVNDLNELHSYEESVAYLHNELKWNIEDAAVADFVKLLEKRFS